MLCQTLVQLLISLLQAETELSLPVSQLALQELALIQMVQSLIINGYKEVVRQIFSLPVLLLVEPLILQALTESTSESETTMEPGPLIVQVG